MFIFIISSFKKVAYFVSNWIRYFIFSKNDYFKFFHILIKFGFKNINRVEYVAINIDTLNALSEAKQIENFDIDVLKQNGLISGKDRVKVLGRGELNAKINVTAHAFSASAKKAIEDKGGVVTII